MIVPLRLGEAPQQIYRLVQLVLRPVSLLNHGEEGSLCPFEAFTLVCLLHLLNQLIHTRRTPARYAGHCAVRGNARPNRCDPERMTLNPLDEIRFLMQTHADAQRTLLCEPHQERAVQAAVDQLEVAGVFTVKPSPACPPGRILVLDEQAMEASWRQTVQRAGHGIRLHG